MAYVCRPIQREAAVGERSAPPPLLLLHMPSGTGLSVRVPPMEKRSFASSPLHPFALKPPPHHTAVSIPDKGKKNASTGNLSTPAKAQILTNTVTTLVLPGHFDSPIQRGIRHPHGPLNYFLCLP